MSVHRRGLQAKHCNCSIHMAALAAKKDAVNAEHLCAPSRVGAQAAELKAALQLQSFCFSTTADVRACKLHIVVWGSVPVLLSLATPCRGIFLLWDGCIDYQWTQKWRNCETSLLPHLLSCCCLNDVSHWIIRLQCCTH